MSDDDDAQAVLFANVMSEILGLRISGRDLLEELARQIQEGDRTASDTLRNPWNTSVPASRKIEAIETKLNALRDTLLKTGPVFLAAWLESGQLAAQLENHHARTVGDHGTALAQTGVVLEPGIQRILDTLVNKAGITNRVGVWVSIDTVVRAGLLIKGQAEERWCDEMVSVPELAQSGLMPLVCVLHGWSAETGELRDFDVIEGLWPHDPEQDTWREEICYDPKFNLGHYRTVLPIPMAVAPPERPRDWTPESAEEMHPVLWDTLPPDKFYRSFANWWTAKTLPSITPTNGNKCRTTRP